ncbi:MAG TPA: nucleotide exchange factor GrpE [Burkholderiaceae bacterium]|nr:nucleotide exchange factor GrpE [Burkholderiaceae bacterium]
MSENKPTNPNPTDETPMGADGIPVNASAEEREAAQAANESEAISELAIAQAAVATLTAKVADLQDQYIRGQAEVQNARRRADEDISKARKFAVEAFAESLLPVTDSLEAGLAIKDAAIEQVREGDSLKAMREGMEATLRQLISALERNKVIAINPEPGSKFDPHQHQAISVVPSDLEANAVVMVLQKGYLIADRVLRPALVTVSAPK